MHKQEKDPSIWVVGASHGWYALETTPHPLHDFPKCAALKDSAFLHCDESSPNRETLHSCGTPATTTPLLWPSCLLGKGPTQQSLSEKPPWETAQRDHLHGQAAELLVAGQPPGVQVASQRALTIRHSKPSLSLGVSSCEAQ